MYPLSAADGLFTRYTNSISNPSLVSFFFFPKSTIVFLLGAMSRGTLATFPWGVSRLKMGMRFWGLYGHKNPSYVWINLHLSYFSRDGYKIVVDLQNRVLLYYTTCTTILVSYKTALRLTYSMDMQRHWFLVWFALFRHRENSVPVSLTCQKKKNRKNEDQFCTSWHELNIGSSKSRTSKKHLKNRNGILSGLIKMHSFHPGIKIT